MTPFIEKVAARFVKEYGNNISNFTFIFPSRRAGRFFQRYIGIHSEQPIFSPNILTLNEFLSNELKYEITDHFELLFRLYDVYIKLTQHEESFDDFIFWGEVLLKDFNDVDKYLADAKQLYTNIKDINEIDQKFQSDIFSPAQIEAIQSFWESFQSYTEDKDHQQRSFISTWNILGDLYEQFRKNLQTDGLAYEGMIYRDIVTKIENNKNPFSSEKQLVFIGFNALCPCEIALFKHLQKNHNADFYWDYEAPQTKDDNNPASFFCENSKLFPSKFAIEEDSTEHSTDFQLIGTPSVVGQAKEIGKILKNMNLKNDSVAVILPNERLLMPLLYSLPLQKDGEYNSNVNITMGYPLSNTPLADLVSFIFSLQRNSKKDDNGTVLFYHKDVRLILSHLYIAPLIDGNFLGSIINQNLVFIEEKFFESSTLLSKIFKLQTPDKLTDYLIDILTNITPKGEEDDEGKISFSGEEILLLNFISLYKEKLQNIQQLLQCHKMQITLDTFFQVVGSLMATTSVPFEGNALNGLQVMGVLESRNLDFDTLIIPCMNEGEFPRISNDNSFIPYNLRKGFGKKSGKGEGLPTGEHIDSVYAYHFYRLIYRAKKVYFLYNTSTGNEISRYIQQMRYLDGINIPEKSIIFNITTETKVKNIAIAKNTDEVISAFEKYKTGEKQLSASALISYIKCPLQFYYSNIIGLYEENEVKETMNNADFGTVFHYAMQLIYNGQEKKTITPELIDFWLKNNVPYKNVCTAIGEKMLHLSSEKAQNVKLVGDHLLNAHIIEKLAERMLLMDKAHAPFTYIASEFKIDKFEIKRSNGEPVFFKGYIDRMDEKDNTLRIIDYKTNNPQNSFNSIDELTNPLTDPKNSKKEIFQLLCYSLYLQKNNPQGYILQPGLVITRSLFTEQYSPSITYNRNELTIEKDNELLQNFEEKLTCLIDEIFNPEIPFSQTENEKHCEYCDFSFLCKKY